MERLRLAGSWKAFEDTIKTLAFVQSGKGSNQKLLKMEMKSSDFRVQKNLAGWRKDSQVVRRKTGSQVRRSEQMGVLGKMLMAFGGWWEGTRDELANWGESFLWQILQSALCLVWVLQLKP